MKGHEQLESKGKKEEKVSFEIEKCQELFHLALRQCY